MHRNLIFLHLPKNAGTSFDMVLEPEFVSDETFSIRSINSENLNTDEFTSLPAARRHNIHLLKGHMLFGLHDYLFGPSDVTSQKLV